MKRFKAYFDGRYFPRILKNTSSPRVINKQQLAKLKETINVSIAKAPKYINRFNNENKRVLLDNLSRLNKWYMTKVTKLEQVELSQKKVEALQDKLQNAQENRRHIERQLQLINEKALQLKEGMFNVNRRDNSEKFHDLLAKQAEILRLESSTYKEFQNAVELEKEIFTAYCNAIRASYEKLTYQRQYAKTKIHERGVNNILDEKLNQIDKRTSVEFDNKRGAGSYISSSIKWIGSAPGYAYGYIKPIVPSYSSIISAPQKTYAYIGQYFTGKK